MNYVKWSTYPKQRIIRAGTYTEEIWEEPKSISRTRSITETSHPLLDDNAILESL